MASRTARVAQTAAAAAAVPAGRPAAGSHAVGAEPETAELVAARPSAADMAATRAGQGQRVVVVQEVGDLAEGSADGSSWQAVAPQMAAAGTSWSVAAAQCCRVEVVVKVHRLGAAAAQASRSVGVPGASRPMALAAGPADPQLWAWRPLFGCARVRVDAQSLANQPWAAGSRRPLAPVSLAGCAGRRRNAAP